MRRTALAWALAALCACLFWWPLCRGQCPIGGDTYTYYLPLRTYYADGLRRGELRLWHDRIGYGAPVLGESQTGVFYPPNLVLYGLLPVPVAYNVSLLLHFTLAMGLMYHYGRCIGGSMLASLFGGLAFAYSWFPARGALEWAYTTGAWLPLALCGLERLIATGRWRWGLTMAVAVSLQLLAGHFQVAFITLVGVGLYAAVRCVADPHIRARWIRRMGLVAGFAVLAMLLSAVQLAPSWELKAVSQRQGVQWTADLLYGYLPWWYMGQMVFPYAYYYGLTGGVPLLHLPTTNVVEASLYPGLLALWLALAGWWAGRRRPVVWTWVVIAVVSGGLACGVGLGWLAHVPGFSYFRYPGRYSLLVCAAVAALAAIGIDALRKARPKPWAAGVLIGLQGVGLVVCSAILVHGGWTETAARWWASHTQLTQPFGADVLTLFRELVWGSIAVMVVVGVGIVLLRWALIRWRAAVLILAALAALEYAYVAHRHHAYNLAFASSCLPEVQRSEIARRLGPGDRLVADGPNLFTLLGVACVPPYMGLGPAAYYDDEVVMRKLMHRSAPTVRERMYLRLQSASHLVSTSPLPCHDPAWPIRLVWRGHDPFIHRAWGRAPNAQPLNLYRVDGFVSRAYLVADLDATAPGTSLGRARVVDRGTHRVEVACEATAPAWCVLAELHYPGWSATVDGRPVAIEPFQQVFRAVPVAEGRHRITFTYRPLSVLLGAAVSLLALCGVGVGAAVFGARRRRVRPRDTGSAEA